MRLGFSTWFASAALLMPFQALANDVQQPACRQPRLDLAFDPLNGPIQSPGSGFRMNMVHENGAGAFDVQPALNNHDGIGRAYFRLDPWKDGSDLPADFLAQLDNDLKQARANGVKLTLRFAYTYPCEPPSVFNTPGAFKPQRIVCDQDVQRGGAWNDPKFQDASLDTVLKHIQQLGPVLRRNADVLQGVGGFVGMWGEQHSSTNGLSINRKDPPDKQAAETDNQRKIIQALQANFPGQILMRYPWARKLVTADGNASVASDRIGLEDDCFLADDHDAGTYVGKDADAIATEKAGVTAVSQRAIVGGEACHVNPPRSDCQTAIQELRQLRFSFLTDGFPAPVMQGWKSTNTQNDDGSSVNCYKYIKQHLGPRLSLLTASLDSQARPGSPARFKAVLRNQGFAPVYAPQPTYVKLQCDGGYVSPLLPLKGTNVDASAWQPGSDTAVDASFVVPSDAPRGRCEALLALPNGCDPVNHAPGDADESARSKNCQDNLANPLNYMELANNGPFQTKTGLNRLTDQFQLVDNPLPACPDPNAPKSSGDATPLKDNTNSAL